jgi:hypothetical protein
MNMLRFTKGMAAAPCRPRRSPDRRASDGGSEGTALADPESQSWAFPPRSASRNEEMEKRSRQRVRDQVAHMAFGAETRMRSSARISMMARNTNVPFKGRTRGSALRDGATLKWRESSLNWP